jgi:hypothetical protein
LVGRAQAQLLLMFYTLPKMKDSLQRKMKGHVRGQTLFVRRSSLRRSQRVHV